MYSQRFAEESKQLLSALEVEQGAHDATRRCYDVMLAVAGLHTEAMRYSAAAQQQFETDLEVEDGFAVQTQAEFDAARAAEAKEAFEKAVERFNRAIGRLTVAS
jgi:hypothetical protein